MKNLNVLAMELRKQRNSFFATLFVLVAGVCVPAFLLPMVRNVGMMDSFFGAAALLFFLLPLANAFLGSSAASALRKTDQNMMEEPLPIHPLVRVYSAYIASFLYSSCISLLVLSLLGHEQIFYLVNARFGIFQMPIEIVLLYTVSLHCLSFMITYFLNLPILGAGLALILSAIDFFFQGILYLGKHGVLMYHFGGQFPKPFSLMFFFPMLFIWVAPAIAAFRIERNKPVGLVRILALATCFLAAPVWSFVMVETIVNAVETQMFGSLSFWNSFWDLFAAGLP